MKLYFVRHGESEANVLREISNRGFKHGLTERGFHQATELAINLRRMNFSKIYSSPLKRAYQTAEVLSEKLEIPMEVTDALREFDCGIAEGRSDPESWEYHSQVFENWLLGNWDARIPEGESHIDIQERFLPFINSIRQNHVKEKILLVGHGGTYLAALPLILENIDFDFVRHHHIEHTSPIIVDEREGSLICIQWGQKCFE
jgi:probable phosphoglycerate mutase